LSEASEKQNTKMPPKPLIANKQLIDVIVEVLGKDERVVFAYLYGSLISEGQGNDVDIAVYSKDRIDPHLLSAELKIALNELTGISPDAFDFRIINDILEKGDIFAVLYLRNVLEDGRLLVNKAHGVHSDFLERYGSKFRECEGLMQEVLA
jgi:uncharacterized protein